MDERDPEIRREPPTLAAGITGPVVIPLLQSVITGLLVALAVTLLASMALTWLRVPAPGLKIFIFVWAAATLWSWLTYRWRWQYVIESVLGVDVNRDGHVGFPPLPSPPPTVRVVLEQNHGREVDFIDLPYADRLPQLAAWVAGGRPFSLSGARPLLNRVEFETLRGELMGRGLARWKVEGAPGQGVELTPAGRAVFRRLAEQHTHEYEYPQLEG